jgi:ABC-2 type transport system ATP-binding protein
MASLTGDSPEVVMRVDGLSKRFGRLTALDGVSFDIRRGETLGLIGPNGAGKTTLFEGIAGLLPMDAGAVRVDERAVAPRDRARHLFFVPDGIAPWPTETVDWALDYAVGFFGGDASRRVQVIRQFDLGGVLDAPIGTLSKGQRKRALLAFGFLMPQPVLLIDEPFEGLDLRQSRDLAIALATEAARGRTLFLSIHQISDAARICERFVLLSSGRVRGEGTLAALASMAGAPGGASTLEEVFLALT